MPNFVSINGKWKPAREVVQLPLTQEELEAGKNPVYSGPDRAAQSLLQEMGVDELGADFRTNPEFMQRVRQAGFTSVDEYLSMFGIDPKENAKKNEELLKKPAPNQSSRRNKAVKTPGGGVDTSGSGQHRDGGFGMPNDVDVPQLKA